MTRTMMLRSVKGHDDPKNLEGVLSVLERRMYDGGDDGIVLDPCLGAEAVADLELGLGGPEGLLAALLGHKKKPGN